METRAEVWIPLTQGKAAVIDFEDFEKVRPYKWNAKKMGQRFYASRLTSRKLHESGKQYTILMHKEIMQPGAGLEVDHKDGDGLNNRRSSNLRIATKGQNLLSFRKPKAKYHSSKFRGVVWHKVNKKWVAAITVNHVRYYLGSFANEADAAKAYDKRATTLCGEFVALNFPDQKENKCSQNNGGNA